MYKDTRISVQSKYKTFYYKLILVFFFFFFFFFVSPAKQKCDICIAFPAGLLSSSVSVAAAAAV